MRSSTRLVPFVNPGSCVFFASRSHEAYRFAGVRGPLISRFEVCARSGCSATVRVSRTLIRVTSRRFNFSSLSHRSRWMSSLGLSLRCKVSQRSNQGLGRLDRVAAGCTVAYPAGWLSQHTHAIYSGPRWTLPPKEDKVCPSLILVRILFTTSKCCFLTFKPHPYLI